MYFLVRCCCCALVHIKLFLPSEAQQRHILSQRRLSIGRQSSWHAQRSGCCKVYPENAFSAASLWQTCEKQAHGSRCNWHLGHDDCTASISLHELREPLAEFNESRHAIGLHLHTLVAPYQNLQDQVRKFLSKRVELEAWHSSKPTIKVKSFKRRE
jgi:hypothetical protein